MSLERQKIEEISDFKKEKLAQNNQSENPGVSIIIPAYNYAHYLPFAIDSSLNQTYSPVEIIIIDDGSTDNTAEVVAGYGEKVRYIYQKNAGLSAARNTGIREAKFDYLVFLDADDELEPNMVESAMKRFAELPPDFAIVACLSKYIDSKGNLIKQKDFYYYLCGEISASDILLMTRFAPSSVVVKKSAFDACGCFDTSLRSSEDRDMWIRIAQKFKIYLSPEALVKIRKHSSNMSSNASRMKENMARVICKAWNSKIVPFYKFWTWLQILSIHRFQVSLIYLGIGENTNAIRELSLSFLFWPFPFLKRQIGIKVPFIRLRSLGRAIFCNK